MKKFPKNGKKGVDWVSERLYPVRGRNDPPGERIREMPEIKIHVKPEEVGAYYLTGALSKVLREDYGNQEDMSDVDLIIKVDLKDISCLSQDVQVPFYKDLAYIANEVASIKVEGIADGSHLSGWELPTIPLDINTNKD